MSYGLILNSYTYFMQKYPFNGTETIFENEVEYFTKAIGVLDILTFRKRNRIKISIKVFHYLFLIISNLE